MKSSYVYAADVAVRQRREAPAEPPPSKLREWLTRAVLDPKIQSRMRGVPVSFEVYGPDEEEMATVQCFPSGVQIVTLFRHRECLPGAQPYLMTGMFTRSLKPSTAATQLRKELTDRFTRAFMKACGDALFA